MKPAKPLLMQAVVEDFYKKPLSEMRPQPRALRTREAYRAVLERLSDVLNGF
jgi:hypothetical protein